MSADQEYSFIDKVKKLLKMEVTTNEKEPTETAKPVKKTKSGHINDVKEKFFNLFKKNGLPCSEDVKDPDVEETKKPSKGNVSAKIGSGDPSEGKKGFFRLPKIFKKRSPAPLYEAIRTSDSLKETIVKPSEPISINDERFQLESGIKRDFDASSALEPEEKSDLTDSSTEKFEKVHNSADMSLIPGRIILTIFG